MRQQVSYIAHAYILFYDCLIMVDGQMGQHNYVYTYTGISKVNEMCNYAEATQLVID